MIYWVPWREETASGLTEYQLKFINRSNQAVLRHTSFLPKAYLTVLNESINSKNTINEHDRHTPPRSLFTDSSPVALMQISANVLLIFCVCLSSTEICIKLQTREQLQAVMELKGR